MAEQVMHTYYQCMCYIYMYIDVHIVCVCMHYTAETAINIGYSSKLLVEDMRVFIINAEDKAGVEKQLNDVKYVIPYSRKIWRGVLIWQIVDFK